MQLQRILFQNDTHQLSKKAVPTPTTKLLKDRTIKDGIWVNIAFLENIF